MKPLLSTKRFAELIVKRLRDEHAKWGRFPHRVAGVEEAIEEWERLRWELFNLVWHHGFQIEHEIVVRHRLNDGTLSPNTSSGMREKPKDRWDY